MEEEKGKFQSEAVTQEWGYADKPLVIVFQLLWKRKLDGDYP